MRSAWIRMSGTVFFSLCALGLRGQSPARVSELASLPAGLTLPVEIGHGLEAGHTMAGSPVVAVLTQRVFVDREHYVPEGTRVVGTVEVSRTADHNTHMPAVLTLEFSGLSLNRQIVPIRTAALAVANVEEVRDAAEPANSMTGRGSGGAANWSTRQVGGDEVYRAGWEGPVLDANMKTVGHADYYGVYANPIPGASGAGALPRALGVFSADATGLYGFPEETHLTNHVGEISLSAPVKLVLRRGDNFLLTVLPPAGAR